MGSRACAANHYVIASELVIAEKCPYVMSNSAILDFPEWFSIIRSLYRSENVARRTVLLKIDIVYKERRFVFRKIWKFFDKYCRNKLKVKIFCL